ncbi:hypothetical protein A374_07161 [Fictibacillus macauensis ZFHKF-1]|uniref:Uncharacterized protein n=1 Tax=Fictibacillus macauensis ZFHKF-1 TaxID=1196324 RepID=I8UGQ7_9BACL|nr:hypothetical protein [Fictibacillus macauensis]EIT86080.1 hypothetical protein A374_07161 [Fictibacillus macauensis ZFHKF-1]
MILNTLTIILGFFQLTILTFWLIDWQPLYSRYGLWAWALGILLNGLLPFLYRNKHSRFRKLAFLSASCSLALALLTLLIDYTVNSMP